MVGWRELVPSGERNARRARGSERPRPALHAPRNPRRCTLNARPLPFPTRSASGTATATTPGARRNGDWRPNLRLHVQPREMPQRNAWQEQCGAAPARRRRRRPEIQGALMSSLAARPGGSRTSCSFRCLTCSVPDFVCPGQLPRMAKACCCYRIGCTMGVCCVHGWGIWWWRAASWPAANLRLLARLQRAAPAIKALAGIVAVRQRTANVTAPRGAGAGRRSAAPRAARATALLTSGPALA
jgi:hypothetical protein